MPYGKFEAEPLRALPSSYLRYISSGWHEDLKADIDDELACREARSAPAKKRTTLWPAVSQEVASQGIKSSRSARVLQQVREGPGAGGSTGRGHHM